MILKEKYKKTLNYILELPKDNDGVFTIDYKDAMTALGISQSTFHRHLNKLLESNSITAIYKGGVFIEDQLYRDILKDGNHNPNSFNNSLYCVGQCSQLKKDIAILKYALGWPELDIKHYLWWADAESLKYDDAPVGLSETTTKLLQQYVKYMVKGEIYFDNKDVYEKFCLLSA